MTFLQLAVCIEYNFDIPSDYDIKKGRISGIRDREDKDIIIGGLLGIHFHEGDGKCSDKVDQANIENMEAMLYAIDAINSDDSLLPNITLGYDIRDTCISESVALDESADLIVSNGQIDLESCENVVTTNKTAPVLGVIGAIVSFVSIPVASFFRLFKMPQISFSSTSPILNDRDRYSFFFRTVPSDDQQAQAMIDIILHFEWDHVSTIYSNNLYGQPGIIQFHRLADKYKICIDLNEGLEDDKNKYNDIARKLYNNASSNIVVLFASGHHAEDFLHSVLELSLNYSKRFLWIASDAWSEVVDGKFDNITVGKWGLAPLAEKVHAFDEYYSLLTPATNARNPWFSKSYQQYFDCNNTNCANSSIPQSAKYVQNSYDSLAIDSVYSLAQAINNFLFEHCEQPIIWYPFSQTCKGSNQTLDGETLHRYLYSLNFTSPTGSTVKFNENGAITGKYQILNYQLCKNCSNKYTLVKVGKWDGSHDNRLQLYSNVQQQFGVDSSGNIRFELNLQCQLCSPGYTKREVISSCCGTCDPCLGQNYTNVTNSLQCKKCPVNMWGNNPLNGSDRCIDIEESYLKPHDGWAISLMILALVGLLSTTFVVSAFVWFWKTPIVKSSGREQMILLLIGITLCFILTISFVVKPSPTACAFQRIGQWFSISLILSSLLVKLVRISRIFLQKTASGVRPKLIGPWYQVLFTFLLVGCEMIFVMVSLVVVHPDIIKSTLKNKENQIDFPQVVIYCAQPHIALTVIKMVYCTLLLIASNVLAILTIRFPENFNESKYVAFSTFSLGLIWIAFVFTYFATNTEPQHQNAILSFAIQLSALAVLVCMFVPRVFIMIFRPKQNVKKKSLHSSTIKSAKSQEENNTTSL